MGQFITITIQTKSASYILVVFFCLVCYKLEKDLCLKRQIPALCVALFFFLKKKKKNGKTNKGRKQESIKGAKKKHW